MQRWTVETGILNGSSAPSIGPTSVARLMQQQCECKVAHTAHINLIS